MLINNLRYVCFVALLCIYIPLSNAATLALNSGFEDGVLTPWYQGIGTLDYPHDEFWSISSSRFFSGNYSATNVGNNELRQDFTPIAASQITEVSFYLLRESIAFDSAIQLHYSDGTWDQVIVPSQGADFWEHINITGSLNQTKNLSGISIFGIRSSDPGGLRLYIDDMNIAAIPLPAGIWLFSSGLLGLTGIARR